MRSPAAAIAWEFRQRHRWGLTAIAAGVIVLAAIHPLVGRVQFASEVTFALVVVVPLSATFLYFLAVFSFGLSGDLAARQSIFPARMFTLPLTTEALVAWPMLYGTAAMALLWGASRMLAVWPSEFNVPVVWPALLAASLLAWTQALTWMPYALPGLRVIVTVMCLSMMEAVIMTALHFKASEPVMLAILAPHVPLAYLTARYAVGRARRGDVPDWRRASSVSATSRRPDFPTPARAQRWFEWRLHGLSLPAQVAILLPFELSLLFIFSETPAIVFETLAGVLLTPPFMAIFVAATVSSGLTPFLATRPTTNASLIAAKMKATMASTLAAWVLVLAAIPMAVRFSGTTPMVIGWAHDLVAIAGTRRAVTIALLVLLALMASTWKQLVQSLYIGLSGREWIVKTSVFAALALLAVFLPLGHWIFQSRWRIGVLLYALPWIMAVLAGLKLSVAVWIAMRLRDRGLVGDRALLIGAISWDVAVFALYGVLVWLTPGILFRRDYLALVAIVFVPLTRIAAAPLAVAWNRHR